MVQPDKIKHMILLLLTAVGSAFVLQCFSQDIIYCWPIAMTLGVGKELIDKYWRKKIFDWRDIYADAIGATVGLFVATIIWG